MIETEQEKVFRYLRRTSFEELSHRLLATEIPKIAEMDEYFELQEKHDAMPIGDEKAQIAKVLDALWDEMESAIDKDREPIYAECGWTGVEWLIEECNRSDSQNSSR